MHQPGGDVHTDAVVDNQGARLVHGVFHRLAFDDEVGVGKKQGVHFTGFQRAL